MIIACNSRILEGFVLLLRIIYIENASFGGWWSVALTNRGRSKKTEGWPA